MSYLSDNSRYTSYVQPDTSTVSNLDNIMPSWAQDRFKEVSRNFLSVFTKAPGKNNRYFGRVDTSLEFATLPTPNTKVYHLKYSDKQLSEMGSLMDKLMEYGVLQRPEDIGVTLIVVSPSLLVPKMEPGEYRLVTDFTSLNKHIVKFPSVFLVHC